jgi:hypothetical protein
VSVPPHQPPSRTSGDVYGPEGVWGPPPTPSWMRGGPPPPGPALPSPGQRPRTAADRPLVLVLVALASLLVGGVGGGIAMLLFLSGAQDPGWGLGEEFAQSEDGPGPGGETGYRPVDQFPPTAPGALGDDPTLDAHASDCFDGDLAACDTLYFEAPPMSDYEEYAITCGGRVKAWAVVSCTELD